MVVEASVLVKMDESTSLKVIIIMYLSLKLMINFSITSLVQQMKANSVLPGV